MYNKINMRINPTPVGKDENGKYTYLKLPLEATDSGLLATQYRLNGNAIGIWLNEVPTDITSLVRESDSLGFTRFTGDDFTLMTDTQYFMLEPDGPWAGFILLKNQRGATFTVSYTGNGSPVNHDEREFYEVRYARLDEIKFSIDTLKDKGYIILDGSTYDEGDFDNYLDKLVYYGLGTKNDTSVVSKSFLGWPEIVDKFDPILNVASLPNIKGTAQDLIKTDNSPANEAIGALYCQGSIENYDISDGNGYDGDRFHLHFDAARSNSVYGKNGNTSRVIPEGPKVVAYVYGGQKMPSL